MSLAKRFYKILVEVLYEVNDLEAGASQLQADRAIARRFGVSESTARNWRRGKNTQVAPATANAIIAACEQLDPARVPDLEFIDRLTRGTQEIKLATELLVDELSTQVFTDNSSWHIYSGPLKMAFDLNANPLHQTQLLGRAGMITERILEMGVEQDNIPAIGEMIRYSVHGWYAKGLYKIREASLSSQTVGIASEGMNTIEAALYIGDGCGNACLHYGDVKRARAYLEQALDLLATANPAEEHQSPVERHDAHIMLRSLQAMVACHEGYAENRALLTQFVQDIGPTHASNEWVEGTRHESLGYVELVRRTDFAKATYHFEESSRLLDHWLTRFGVPFCSLSPQSLSGYAMLMTQGPTDSVKLQVTEGLVRTIDYGGISQEVRARLCLALFHSSRGEEGLARFHRDQAEELVQHYDLYRWYQMIQGILLPPGAQPYSIAG